MSLTKTKLMSQLFNVKLYLFKLLTFCILGSSYPSKRACKHITGGEKKKKGGGQKRVLLSRFIQKSYFLLKKN